MSALGLVGGHYEVDTSKQTCINLYPEVTEQGGRNKGSLRSIPGLSSFSTVGEGPIRGMHVMNGVLYVVSGTVLYSVNSSGSETSLGTIVGSDPVGMAHNIGLQLMVTTGSTGYIYTTSTGLVTISDADFPANADMVHYMGTYFIVNNRTTQEFWISNTGDGTNWLGTDFASKEGEPSNLVALIPNHQDLFLFGEKSYEIWKNTGNADFAFEIQDGTFQERGCSAKWSVASLDNTVYFLGDDKVVYRIDGYQPVRVSDHGVESSLDSLDVSDAVAYTYTQNGHYFYCLNIGSLTWVYDATFSGQTGRATWHKRRTGIGEGRWRVNNYVNVYGKHLGGDYSSGIIWEMSLSTYTDNGSEIERIRTLPHIYSDIRPINVDRMELSMKTGVGNSAVTDPQVWLEVSKDGGRTWSDRILASMGQAGDYDRRVVWRRLGRARDWVFRFTTTEPCEVVWYEAHADANVGES